MGRPSKADEWLTEDALLLIKGWARDGLSNKQIAEDKIGIGEKTFYQWCERYPQFKQTIKEGRQPVTEKIVEAFYDRCTQYKEVVETTEEIVVDGEGRVISKRIRKNHKIIPPDTTAIIFALKNLKPQVYKDRRHEEITVGSIDQSTIDEVGAYINAKR